MTAIELNQTNTVYLTNSLGEKTSDRFIGEQVITWYRNTKTDNDWFQYLVELNGNDGILAIMAFTAPSHEMEQDNENYSEKWLYSTPEATWNYLKEIASHFSDASPYDVLIGKETGFLGKHEICIFFPFETKKESLEKTFKQLEEIKELY